MPRVNGSRLRPGSQAINQAAYPAREPYFAHRFIRLMARTCLGARISPDACWVLSIIAMTEDAKRYSGPVTFYNPNLADQAGISISSLDRAREKAIAEGWLHYEAGTKHKAGIYWVTVPVEESNKADVPTCEDDPALRRQIDEESDEESGRLVKKNPEGKRRPFLPAPAPAPNPIAALPLDQLGEDFTGNSPLRNDEPMATPRNALWDAIVQITGTDASIKSIASHVGKVRKALSEAKPPYTAADVLTLPDVMAVHCTWAAGRIITLGEVEKNIHLVRSKATPVRSAQKAEPPLRKAGRPIGDPK